MSDTNPSKNGTAQEKPSKDGLEEAAAAAWKQLRSLVQKDRATNWVALGLIGTILVGGAIAYRAVQARNLQAAKDPPFTVWNGMRQVTFDMLAQGEFEAAKVAAARTLRYAADNFGPNHVAVAESCETLAQATSGMSDYTSAEPLYAKALQIYATTFGPTSKQAAVCAGRFGLMLARVGNFAEAKPLLDKALEIQKSLVGPADPDTAIALNNLGVYYDELGEPENAVPLHEQALEIRRKKTGPASQDTAVSLTNLATSLREASRGQTDKDRKAADAQRQRARSLYRQAKAIRECTTGLGDVEYSSTLLGMSVLALLEGDLEQADLDALSCLAIRQEKLGLGHALSAAACDALAQVRMRQDRNDEAMQLLEVAVAQREKWLGPLHRKTLESADRLLSCLAKLDDQDEVIKQIEPIFTAREAVAGPDGDAMLPLLAALEAAHAKAKRPDDAKRFRDRSEQIKKAAGERAKEKPEAEAKPAAGKSSATK